LKSEIRTCVKCGLEYPSLMITTTRTYTNNDANNPVLTTRTFERPQFRKCQLCRNIGKALDFINSKMGAGN